MRFEKGSKVEVLSTRGMPSGSWRSAEIISGNGYSYTVRYDGYAGNSDLTVLEKISRNAIRPCPPIAKVVENWVPGDIVEINVDFSWKMATISKFLSKSYFLVRLLGSSLELKVSKFDIRARQFWQGDKWVTIRKASGNSGDKKIRDESTLNCSQISPNYVQPSNARSKVRLNKEKFLESRAASRRILKRGPHGSTHNDANKGVAKKIRAVENEGKPLRLASAYEIYLPKQVDPLQREPVGEKFLDSLFENAKEFPDKISARRRKPTVGIDNSFAAGLESSDSESLSCSVGSCSITSNQSYKVRSGAGFIEDVDGNDSDAESFCQSRHEEGNSLVPNKEVVASEIHRLELHAYRCTMEALHASGPLSWEQEALVTNLRLLLHISNDEHLMEVRNLISADNSIRNR